MPSIDDDLKILKWWKPIMLYRYSLDSLDDNNIITMKKIDKCFALKQIATFGCNLFPPNNMCQRNLDQLAACKRYYRTFCMFCCVFVHVPLRTSNQRTAMSFEDRKSKEERSRVAVTDIYRHEAGCQRSVESLG